LFVAILGQWFTDFIALGLSGPDRKIRGGIEIRDELAPAEF
jgi:hypothetical protein